MLAYDPACYLMTQHVYVMTQHGYVIREPTLSNKIMAKIGKWRNRKWSHLKRNRSYQQTSDITTIPYQMSLKMALSLSLVLTVVMLVCSAMAQEDICQLEKAKGNCYASILSFYFDVNSNRCQPFLYGGCGGNANRFEYV